MQRIRGVVGAEMAVRASNARFLWCASGVCGRAVTAAIAGTIVTAKNVSAIDNSLPERRVDLAVHA